MSRIVLIGAGGHGKVVAETAEACGYEDVVFHDQNWPELKSNGRWQIIGAPQLPNIADGSEALFCSIGNNAVREKIFNEYELEQCPILIHPSTVLSPSARLGAGTLVVAGAIINADARLGLGCILNTACSVDHDCVLGDFVHISPGARLAGNVTIGSRSWIGIGAVVKEGVTIGSDVMVAAGAAVVTDIKDGDRVGGVPAQQI